MSPETCIDAGAIDPGNTTRLLRMIRLGAGIIDLGSGSPDSVFASHRKLTSGKSRRWWRQVGLKLAKTKNLFIGRGNRGKTYRHHEKSANVTKEHADKTHKISHQGQAKQPPK